MDNAPNAATPSLSPAVAAELGLTAATAMPGDGPAAPEPDTAAAVEGWFRTHMLPGSFPNPADIHPSDYVRGKLGELVQHLRGL